MTFVLVYLHILTHFRRFLYNNTCGLGLYQSSSFSFVFWTPGVIIVFVMVDEDSEEMNSGGEFY